MSATYGTPSLWSRSIVTFRHFKDTEPRVADLGEAGLVAFLTTHPKPVCDAKTCKGKPCRFKRSHASWSPVTYKPGSKRGNAGVEAVNYLVGDLDHFKPGDLEHLRTELTGCEYVIYTSHNHAPGAESYRLVLPLTRPMTPKELPIALELVAGMLGITFDPQCKDPARIYAAPDCRIGIQPFAMHVGGEALDVDELMKHRVVKLTARTVPTVPPPSEPTSSDLDELRAFLTGVQRSKASGDEHQQEQADIFGRILQGRPLEKKGSRDNTIWRACRMLSLWLPADTSVETVTELLTPSLEAMLLHEPDERGMNHMLDVVTGKWARAIAERHTKDAEYAKFGAALRQKREERKLEVAPERRLTIEEFQASFRAALEG